MVLLLPCIMWISRCLHKSVSFQSDVGQSGSKQSKVFFSKANPKGKLELISASSLPLQVILISKSLLAVLWVIWIAFVMCAPHAVLHNVPMGELCLTEDLVQSLCDLFSMLLWLLFIYLFKDMHYCVLLWGQQKSTRQWCCNSGFQ